MILKTAILDYTTYNHWANETLTVWLKSLDVELLSMNIKSSFPTINLTLQHMMNAQYFWYAVISNENIDSLDEQLRIKSVDFIIGELLKGSQNLIDIVSTLNDADLLTNVPSPVITRTKYEFILHAVNHSFFGQSIIINKLLTRQFQIANGNFISQQGDSKNRSKSNARRIFRLFCFGKFFKGAARQ